MTVRFFIKATISLLLIVLCFSSLNLPSKIEHAKADAAWLNGFTYRKQHNITGSTVGNQTNYQMKLETVWGSTYNLGYDVSGYSTYILATSEVVGSRFNSTVGGYIEEINLFGRGITGSLPAKVKCAIYFSGNNTFISETEEVEITNTSYIWREWSFSSSVDIAAETEYMLVTKTDGRFNFFKVAGSTNQGVYDTWNFSYAYPFPDPFNVTTETDQKFKIYSSVYANGYEETVYLNEHAQTDFDDVRFTDSDGTTELDYWLESKTDSDTATFWVEIPTVSNLTDNIIYVYYGNATASSTSNGASTFPALFDHFAGSAEPPSGWSENNIHDNRVTWDDLSADSKYKVFDFTDTSAYWHGNEIYKAVTFPTTFAVVSKLIVVCEDDNKPQHTSQLELWSGSVEKLYIGYVDAWIANIGQIRSSITGTDAFTGNSYGSDTYILEVRRDGTNIKTYWNDNLRQTKASTQTFDEVRFLHVGGASLSSSNPQTELEYVFVRKFVDPEPTHGAWGSEESSKAWYDIATWSFSLIARQWLDVSNWNFNITAMQWNEITQWAFNLTTKAWNNIETWAFNLITKGWHDVQTWIFSFTQVTIQVLFIGLVALLLFVCAIIYLALKKK